MWTSMKIVQDFYKAEDHPHAYGDKRYNLYTSPNYLGSSPRVWGQDPNEIAAGEKIIRAVTHAVHDYKKGLTASLTEEQAIDFLTATINRAERGKEKFKIEKPSKFKPVFSDKFKEDNPELSDVDEVFIDIEEINKNALKRKG